MNIKIKKKYEKLTLQYQKPDLDIINITFIV